jgi:DNA-directed RNA polymerase specialized sigma24 family protein
MNSAIVVTAASGGAAPVAAVQVQPKAAAQAPPTRAAAEDSVTISATAQEVQQPTAVQVQLLRNEGQSVQQIATQLAISTNPVQSWYPAQATAQK